MATEAHPFKHDPFKHTTRTNDLKGTLHAESAVANKLCIVREEERYRMTGLSRVSWWRWEREGKAPKRVQLGANSIGWLRHELEAWIEERANARGSR